MRCPHLGPIASVSGSVDNHSCRTNRDSLEHAIIASHQPVHHGLDAHLSQVRTPIPGGDARRRLPLFLRLPIVWFRAETETRRLLRLLLVWLCPVPAHTARTRKHVVGTAVGRAAAGKRCLSRPAARIRPPTPGTTPPRSSPKDQSPARRPDESGSGSARSPAAGPARAAPQAPARPHR